MHVSCLLPHPTHRNAHPTHCNQSCLVTHRNASCHVTHSNESCRCSPLQARSRAYMYRYMSIGSACVRNICVHMYIHAISHRHVDVHAISHDSTQTTHTRYRHCTLDTLHPQTCNLQSRSIGASVALYMPTRHITHMITCHITHRITCQMTYTPST